MRRVPGGLNGSGVEGKSLLDLMKMPGPFGEESMLAWVETWLEQMAHNKLHMAVAQGGLALGTHYRATQGYKQIAAEITKLRKLKMKQGQTNARPLDCPSTRLASTAMPIAVCRRRSGRVQIWTILQYDGPDNLGVWSNAAEQALKGSCFALQSSCCRTTWSTNKTRGPVSRRPLVRTPPVCLSSRFAGADCSNSPSPSCLPFVAFHRGRLLQSAVSIRALRRHRSCLSSNKAATH